MSGITTESERLTPDPINPEDIEIAVNFEPDPADLVLSSVPGGALFNPRKHRFNDEDLKPQPVIKKAKKIYVPEEQKVGLSFWLEVCAGLYSILFYTPATRNS